MVDTSIRIPTSGQVLGALLDALRLKGEVEDALDERTVRRLFNERQPAGDELVLRAVDAAFEILRPEDLLRPFPRELIREELLRWLRHWDALRAHVEANGWTPPSLAAAVEPLLRLTTLDLGLRLGAWWAMGELEGREPLPPLWTLDDALELCFTSLVPEGKREAVRLAVRTNGEDELPAETLRAWRKGKHEPSSRNLEGLARAIVEVCGPTGETEEEQREYKRVGAIYLASHLRVASAATFGRAKLDQLYASTPYATSDDEGRFPPRTTDLVTALREIANWTREILSAPNCPARDEPDLLCELVGLGSRAGLARGLCHDLIRVVACEDPRGRELRADLETLALQWEHRLRVWAASLAHLSDEPQLLAGLASVGAPLDENRNAIARIMGPLVAWDATRMAGFAEAPRLPENARVAAVLRGDPVSAATRKVDEAESVGDLARAEAWARRAVLDGPERGDAHHRLGALLGQIMRLTGRPELQTEAIHECEIAAQLGPDKGSPLFEVGNIHFNVANTLLEEPDARLEAFAAAEAAFARAEPEMNGLLAQSNRVHFLVTRGLALLGMKELGRAREMLVRALDASPEHPTALFALAVIEKKLGRPQDKKYRTLYKKARTAGMPEISKERWERFLDPKEVLTAMNRAARLRGAGGEA